MEIKINSRSLKALIIALTDADKSFIASGSKRAAATESLKNYISCNHRLHPMGAWSSSDYIIGLAKTKLADLVLENK